MVSTFELMWCTGTLPKVEAAARGGSAHPTAPHRRTIAPHRRAVNRSATPHRPRHRRIADNGLLQD